MDSVQNGAPWVSYLSKEEWVATFDWANGVMRECRIVEGAEPTAGWARLSAEWLRDYDHVLPLPPVDCAKRSLLVKGADGCVFNWNTGPERTGALTTVLPEVATLPAPYTTQYAPIVGRWSTRPASGTQFTVRVDMGGHRPTHGFSGDLCVASWDLVYESPHLRTIDLEIDAMADRPTFDSYNTADNPVPPGYVNRRLTLASIYAESGIELRNAGAVNQVGADDSGADLLWSNAELHTAMVHNFSGHADTQQWKLWTLVASRHVEGAGGIMFDQSGSQRQGMAVFYDASRGMFDYYWPYIYAHELGHCFNLVHSWDKANVGAVLGPGNGFADLSFMNYPREYSGNNGRGWDAFWELFPFTFTHDELVHLRHGFRNAVISGGAGFAAWGSAAYSDQDAALAATSTPTVDDTGLALTLSARPFAYGEPVTVEMKLARDGRDVPVRRDLSPRDENTVFTITHPSGTTRVFRPLARQCSGHREDSQVVLTADQPALYASAYLGSGADGQYFTDPGLYTVRAACWMGNRVRERESPLPMGPVVSASGLR
ncbi:hypothetical protein [Actinomadura sp. 6N118]|uniref:hypothetical protein n=1 Tax=Actinomadura sp. 6N118 TaxID=3375151 RepID=UPI0037B35E23